eukprot:CAMPEP_0198324742 /NCGR_PEP_ID=MMETSP1450-20131203/12683_1 /TAXON_ID=753684 ORGANISM="Madagascaria erythrocladiodes, Strain CCMP3234" /NCGR_SAMPLE_ID=MMETSP1450 /ASSEMBLY_ACC=CAM_ASM_001115 /LENGTH=327 /DNA_ID=CAMNT_0044028567 /DNA_START=60 /DNA_END=1043 /DNA_ORIENTATION=+
MGRMVDGAYHAEDDVSVTAANGEWNRTPSVMRHWITPDGSPGPTGEGGFPAVAGRYHLFVAWNCPWAHRTLLARRVKGLTEAVTISVAAPARTEEGWVFEPEGEFADELLHTSALHQVYAQDSQVKYTGRVTVPVLWDKVQKRVVNNESADIVRMLNTAFGNHSVDLYPEPLRGLIDKWNDRIYRSVNNGVYRAGFASTQEAYEKAALEVFAVLDEIDDHLSESRYLAGDTFTEADLRLFPTLARFDVAYHYAFKCNLKKISDYKNLWPYARELYQMPGVKDTVRFDVYKRGYFSRSEKRNPLGIVPIGPLVDWNAPHGRGTPAPKL